MTLSSNASRLIQWGSQNPLFRHSLQPTNFIPHTTPSRSIGNTVAKASPQPGEIGTVGDTLAKTNILRHGATPTSIPSPSQPLSPSNGSTRSPSSPSGPGAITHTVTNSELESDNLMSCTLEKQWTRISAIETWSRKPIRAMTMKRLLETTSCSEKAVLSIAEWVRSELPIRIAHRLYDFHRLPFAVVANPFIRETYDTYARTFDAIVRVGPLTSMEQEAEFERLLTHAKNEHDRTVHLMGKGLQQLKHCLNEPVNLDLFLERFFFFRIGRRIMIDHLISIQKPVEGWAGCFHLHCSPADIAKQQAEQVRESCRVSYGIAPSYTITGHLHTTFACVPDHVSLIITEILKNAMRATVEFYTLGNSMQGEQCQQGLCLDEDDLPPVQIEIYKGRADVAIKISDKGGGIPPHKLLDMWSFGYTTVGRATSPGGMSGALGGCFVRADMAGYGFGLPLSRAFARYFGGDINIQSHFGVGTDVFVTLNHIGDQKEALFFEERADLRATHVQRAKP